MNLKISTTGTVTAIYGEEIDLRELGDCKGSRASHVEMTGNCQFTADMSPMGGPIMGPFTTRSAALAAELEWLDRFLFD